MSDTPRYEDTEPLEILPQFVQQRPEPATPRPEPATPQPEPARPQHRPKRGTGIGCWLLGLLSGSAALILVFVGLLLPPVDLYSRLMDTPYAMLDAANNAVALDDLTLVIDPADASDEFGVALSAVAMDDFLAGRGAAADWVPVAQLAVPPFLALQSPVYDIDTTGTPPGRITLDVALPVGAVNPDFLDLYGRDADDGEWRFIPAQVNAAGHLISSVEYVPDQLAVFQSLPPAQSHVLVAVDTAQVLSREVGELATIVAPAGLQPTLQGALAGSLAPGFDLNAPYRVMPAIRNYADPRALDPETVTALLSNQTLRSEHTLQIAQFAATGNFDGVLIDYRGLPDEQRANFSAFIRELRANMDNFGLLLGVVVPAAENSEGRWQTGAYDWRALGEHVDFMQINFGLDPALYAPGGDRLVEAMLRWAVGEVSRYRLLAGLSALSVRAANGEFTPIGYDEALSALGDVSVAAQTTSAGTIEPGDPIQVKLDGFRANTGIAAQVNSPYIDYLADDGATVARMWLTTADALRFRMDRTNAFGFAGVAFEDLLARGVAGDVLPELLNYKLQLPGGSPREALALRWRIENADGLVREITTGLNDELVTTIEAPDGNYAINVAVVGGGAESRRSGAAVAVFAPTLTPTPVPTATPTLTPTPIPTRAPVVAQAPAVGAAAVAPGAGSIAAGSFEYGGHVTGTGTAAAGAMQRAGMNWMKVQLRYSPGQDPGSAAGAINEAHGRGFKILLGIVGSPGDLAAGGAGYVQGFAGFLGGVAALGPDAIEVWNEQNLDREWPRNQINAAAYTDMLRQSFGAIKSRNSSVMVISGALAPTGAEAAFPGQVVNDDRFLREMVQAGALQWLDCVGVHYNEGIVPPGQQSGDPRDNYYTRFLPGMINTYWNIIGGQKPLCFTELGYLTPEGFGPLPSFFAWAQNVSVAQQAAWLAQAAALASQSGRVRLMIVWNIDFTVYGSDPQAGYAIIRPGGGCPACDALAAAR